MEKRILEFHADEFGDWIAQLECGHKQHLRHNPPWIVREWVTTEEGRSGMLGHLLNCKECDQHDSQ